MPRRKSWKKAKAKEQMHRDKQGQHPCNTNGLETSSLCHDTSQSSTSSPAIPAKRLPSSGTSFTKRLPNSGTSFKSPSNSGGTLKSSSNSGGSPKSSSNSGDSFMKLAQYHNVSTSSFAKAVQTNFEINSSCENMYERIAENVGKSTTEVSHVMNKPQSNTNQGYLRSSNTTTKRSFGTYHQASECFPIFSRGMQCTCNALMSLIVHSSLKCFPLPIDDILFSGDELFRIRIAELQSTESYISKMLLFNELPDQVLKESINYQVLYHQVIYGTVIPSIQDESSNCMNLKEGITNLLENHSMGLIIVGGLCSSIFLDNDNYLGLFDSHPHGFDGLSSCDGKAIHFLFENIDQLTNFLFSFYHSCNISMETQFEIQPLTITRLMAISNEVNLTVHTTPNTNERKSLLDRYFDDQLKKQEIHKKMHGECVIPKTNKKEYMKEYMRKRRQRSEIRDNDRKSTLKSMNKARVNKEFRDKELQSKRAGRESSETRNKDRKSTLKSKSKARLNKEFRDKELQSKRAGRESSETRNKDRKSTLKSMNKARLNKEFRDKELQSKRADRESSETRNKNRKSTLKSMNKARLNKEFRDKELQSKRADRESSETRNKNRKSTLKSMNKARKNKDFCNKEIKSKRSTRLNLFQLERERVLKKESRKRHYEFEKQHNAITKAAKRKAPEFCEHEALLAKRRCFGNSLNQCTSNFHAKAAQGPIYVCTCCHQTWFPKSVVQLNRMNISKQSEAYCTGLKSVNNEEWLCNTCLASLKEEKIPRLSVKNGMKWPDKPEVMNLHSLEERLISQRIPFIQIRELPRGGQLSAKGNIVNVPVDIQPTVNALPRQLDEHITIAVKLKKRLSHKSACFTENVRPNKVMDALKWLLETSELYKNAGITIDNCWKDNIQNNQSEAVKELTGNIEATDDRQVESAHDDFSEVNDDECIQGNSDTLVDDANTDTNKVYVFAPGENQRPLSLYEDKNAEYLCFPSIFCGKTRTENKDRSVPVHYSDIAKWELRSVDRRAAESVPNIFFKLKKIQAKQVSDKVNLAVRRCKTEGKKITAGQVRKPSIMSEIVRLNEGYYIFRTLRNSPAYLSTKKKDVFAMIRQLGLPTWFISLSSADTRWLDLLKTLAQLDGKILSDSEVGSLDWNTKTKLVQKDPVTCARFFENRVQLFLNTVLKSYHNPLGKVNDMFRRVEFQNRGSPHIHMLVWTNDAPKYQKDIEQELIAYVDRYVTCSIESDDPELKHFIDLQIHKHSKTCKKAGKAVCRFGFPLPPLSKTMILEPLDNDVEAYKKKYSEIQKTMNDYKDGCDLDFDSFLTDVLRMSEDEYIKCIRASLKGPKVFLKRRPSEMRVNYYNSAILKAWQANLDIQFVLDPYACATYIVSYISKSQRGISAMLEKASQEAVEGNMDLKRQVRHIGNKFLNFVEVSAQEASYLILQMPLTQATREVVFINTSPPDQRVFLLKNEDNLKDLPADSTDIQADNMIQRYAKRPKQLENWCLADVVAELEVTFPEEMKKISPDEVNDDDLQEDLDEKDFSQNDILVTLKNGIKIRKRKNKRVIRYVCYSRKTNSENYFRERILLFLPWRNEQNDILGGFDTFEQHYNNKANQIKAKQKQYEHLIEELQTAQQLAENEINEFDEVAPNTEHIETEDADAGIIPSEEFIHFNPDAHCHRNYDIGPEIGLPSKSADIETSSIRIPESQYHQLLRCLNSKQREFHDHVTKWLQHKEEPLFAFLTGGAGTGKSVVIDALYQTLHRLLCSDEGENPDDIRILLCAYTGKAAYNINGTTIASALHRKMYQTQQSMHADELNTFRTKYRNLSIVIVDEVSMVGNKMLLFINERLQLLTGRKQDFGGISVIAVGDFYQLSPVGDSWIFKDLTCPGQGLAKNLWKEHFKMFELTEIMRQKDDVEFAELLNRLRHNAITLQDKEEIMKRQILPRSPEYPVSAPHLFIENRFVDDFNSKHIQNLATEKVTVKADTDILSQTKLSNDVKRRLIESLPDNQTHTGQLRSKLTIAVNMMYDISLNVNVSDGLTNGATCIAKHIEYRDSTVRPAIVWVEFSDHKVGTLTRNQYSHMFHEHVEKCWTPIFEVKRNFVFNRKTYERVQFPLQPSAAKTVHKAQGATLEKVVISLSQTKPRKIPHIHYVALSRVKSLEQLHILDFNESSLSKDSNVDDEMMRLRDNELQLCFRPLYTLHAELKCLFNNARSLNKHFKEIQSNQNVLASDIIGIAESRLCATDTDDSFNLDGFNIFRNDATSIQTRPHHGIVLYVKSCLQIEKYHTFTTDAVEFSFVSVNLSSGIVQCTVLYKKPSCPLSQFYTILKDNLVPLADSKQRLMIMGDFNVDLNKPQKQFLDFMLATFGCKQGPQNQIHDDAWCSTKPFEIPENRPSHGVCVANHTSPLDVIILSSDNCYAMVGQSHGGFLGMMQRALSRATSHIWFERSETKDRHIVSKRMSEHVVDENKLPILIFPEGTCINNTSVMMFKKGGFEVSPVVYPVAVKYDSRFGDAFWNSSKESMIHHIYNIMTSWALVVDVWYLPPIERQPDEDAINFANRVKSIIAKKGGLVDLDWDGGLKRSKVKDTLKSIPQRDYSKIIKVD